MKKNILFIIAANFMLLGCELLDETTECENKWDSISEYSFMVYECEWSTKHVNRPADFAFVKFDGEIHKNYCNGTKSGEFLFEKEYTHSELVDIQAIHTYGTDSVYNLHVSTGMQYTYKFEHDEDKVTINLELSVSKLGGEAVYYPLTTMVFTGANLKAMSFDDNIEVKSFPVKDTNSTIMYHIFIYRR